GEFPRNTDRMRVEHLGLPQQPERHLRVADRHLNGGRAYQQVEVLWCQLSPLSEFLSRTCVVVGHSAVIETDRQVPFRPVWPQREGSLRRSAGLLGLARRRRSKAIEGAVRT